MIVGAGQVGYHLSEKLSAEGQDVVLVDSDKAKLRRIEKDLNILTVHGSGASFRILEDAGIGQTDLFIAVTDSDEVNLIACILSQQYGVKTRIARVRDEDFFAEGSPLSESALGINMLISPDLAMVDEVMKMSIHSEAFEVAEFAGGQVVILGYAVHSGNPCIGKTLQMLNRFQGVIVAIIRENMTIIPRGSDSIEAGDKIYIATRKKGISSVERLFNFSSRVPRKVFIIGGGRIGSQVAKRMENEGIEVRLVEKNADHCENLTEQFQKVVVLNCDGLEAHDLLDEGINQADLVISVTDSDTANILSSLLAKHHGAKKCITRINRPDFIPMLGTLGVDVALSPRLVAANMILRFVRGGGKIVSVASLMGSEAEVIELKVPDRKQFRDVALKDLRFPPGSILGAIVRIKKGEVIIPSGNTIIKMDDNLVIFCTAAAINAVECYFA
ncbi:MAG: Trk system potassium transporter TrkA [Desulfobulbaceae bacterium]|nr:Trk system potassium transporter TrkA [Desulfobulbaceae bacterium]